MAKRLREGDIFYVNLNENYIFGKILVDINNRILKLEPKHKYKFYSGCYLVEIYKGICNEPKLTTNEIIVPGQFILRAAFYSKYVKQSDWNFYKNEPIDYKKLDFPEFLETGENGFIDFRKFDVTISTKTLFKDFPQMPTGKEPSHLNQRYTGYMNFTVSQIIDIAVHMQGRDDLLQTEGTYFLIPNELRLSLDDRKRFYHEINEDINISYYELSLKHGFDLGRFYENKNIKK
jgi:hypothetical protein